MSPSIGQADARGANRIYAEHPIMEKTANAALNGVGMLATLAGIGEVLIATPPVMMTLITLFVGLAIFKGQLTIARQKHFADLFAVRHQCLDNILSSIDLCVTEIRTMARGAADLPENEPERQKLYRYASEAEFLFGKRVTLALADLHASLDREKMSRLCGDPGNPALSDHSHARVRIKLAAKPFLDVSKVRHPRMAWFWY